MKTPRGKQPMHGKVSMGSTSMRPEEELHNKSHTCKSKLFRARVSLNWHPKETRWVMDVTVTMESIVKFDIEFDDFEELASYIASRYHPTELDKIKGSRAIVINLFRHASHYLPSNPITDALKDMEDPEVVRDALNDSSIILCKEKDEGALGIPYANLELRIILPGEKRIRHIFEPWDPTTLPFQNRRNVYDAKQVVQAEQKIQAEQSEQVIEVEQKKSEINFDQLSEEEKQQYSCIATFDGALQAHKDISHRRCGCGGSILLDSNKISPFDYVGYELCTFSRALHNTLKSDEAEGAGALRAALLVEEFVSPDHKVALLGDFFPLIKAIRRFRDNSFRKSTTMRNFITDVKTILKPYDKWRAFWISRLLNKLADDWARYATGPPKLLKNSEDPPAPMSGQQSAQISLLQPQPAPQQMQQPLPIQYPPPTGEIRTLWIKKLRGKMDGRFSEKMQQPLPIQYPPPTGEIRTLWIGNLHGKMDEDYIARCFSEKVLSVKLIRNKQTGQLKGYGFIEFSNRAAAERVLQSYTGQLMPNTRQLFRLNWASLGAGECRGDDGTDYTIFVGNLAADVTDYVLQGAFRPYYSSVKGAKVVTDRATGHSKGYGFVRFGNVDEQAHALREMNGTYCSSRPMRIRAATTKKNMGTQQYSTNGKMVIFS